MDNYLYDEVANTRAQIDAGVMVVSDFSLMELIVEKLKQIEARLDELESGPEDRYIAEKE